MSYLSFWMSAARPRSRPPPLWVSRIRTDPEPVYPDLCCLACIAGALSIDLGPLCTGGKRRQ